jgi:ribonuclease-3
LGFLQRIFSNQLSAADQQLAHQLESILGFKAERLQFYRQALVHKSNQQADVAEDNERLEFLGDAILGAIVAEYLFKKYPYQDEGFLTELRSKIVRRETMNNVAMRMGLNKIMQYNQQDRVLNKSHIFGNALEALIGAIYLDKGYEKTRKFIISELIYNYIDLDTLVSTNTNYKNQLLSWAQSNNKTLTFETIEEANEKTRKLFTIGVMLDGEVVATGAAYNKKEAGQVAAHKAMKILMINVPPSTEAEQ